MGAAETSSASASGCRTGIQFPKTTIVVGDQRRRTNNFEETLERLRPLFRRRPAATLVERQRAEHVGERREAGVATRDQKGWRCTTSPCHRARSQDAWENPGLSGQLRRIVSRHGAPSPFELGAPALSQIALASTTRQAFRNWPLVVSSTSPSGTPRRVDHAGERPPWRRARRTDSSYRFFSRTIASTRLNDPIRIKLSERPLHASSICIASRRTVCRKLAHDTGGERPVLRKGVALRSTARTKPRRPSRELEQCASTRHSALSRYHRIAPLASRTKVNDARPRRRRTSRQVCPRFLHALILPSRRGASGTLFQRT